MRNYSEIVSFNTVRELSELLNLDGAELNSIVGGGEAECPSLHSCMCYGMYEGVCNSKCGLNVA